MSIRHTGSTDELVSPPLQGYMRPLKQPDSSSIVDPLLVDDMFYQIPEILEHHELFLEEVAACVGQWNHTQTVGHILIQSVSSTDTAQLSGVKKTPLFWIFNSSVFIGMVCIWCFFISLYQSEILSGVILMDATEKPTQEFLWSAQRLLAVVNWGEKLTKPSVKTLGKKKKNLIVCVCSDWFGELAICGFVYMALQIICAINFWT